MVVGFGRGGESERRWAMVRGEALDVLNQMVPVQVGF